MKIIFNSDNNLTASQEIVDKFTYLIEYELRFYKDFISRVEIHFSDENGPKFGEADHRCMLEVRPDGMQPIAVTDQSLNKELALKGALTKMRSKLETVVGKLQEVR